MTDRDLIAEGRKLFELTVMPEQPVTVYDDNADGFHPISQWRIANDPELLNDEDAEESVLSLIVDIGDPGDARWIAWLINNGEALLDRLTEADQLIADIAELVPGEKSARGNVLGAVGDLRAERDQLKRGGKYLGDIIHRLDQTALDATGLHHLIDETGEGDWQAVWENVSDLGNALAKLRADRAEELAAIARKQQRDADRIAALETPTVGQVVLLKAPNRIDPTVTDYAIAGLLHRDPAKLPVAVAHARQQIADNPDIYRSGAEVVIGDVREARDA